MIKKLNHKELMSGLPELHGKIIELIGGRAFHYVDIPVYGNIGDLLIMHGTLDFFRRNKMVPKTIAPFHSFDSSWIEAGDVVVFQGGGNFGDIYDELQRFRERIIIEKRDNRIIVLPQSIHFQSFKRQSHSARIFGLHPDVHICVRDAESRTLAYQFTKNVYLMPDMAHQLYPISYLKNRKEREVLHLRRVDDEKTEGPAVKYEGTSSVTDWPILIGNAGGWAITSFAWLWRKLFSIKKSVRTSEFMFGLWRLYSKMLTRKAVDLFMRHRIVITDRLHGHILACLMDKQNTVLDNIYGKNSRYVAAWTGVSDIVELHQHAALMSTHEISDEKRCANWPR